MRHWPNGSMACIAGTTLGIAKASRRERDTTAEISVLSALYRVDIWPEDLDRLLREAR